MGMYLTPRIQNLWEGKCGCPAPSNMFLFAHHRSDCDAGQTGTGEAMTEISGASADFEFSQQLFCESARPGPS